ncbi:MAG: sigma-70 family RNA polymerase sigma factor [Gemmatimonadota bacterium]|nr:sigma-70 family RNA polymerase sigma factor [Gemmatimonadota bacterium]
MRSRHEITDLLIAWREGDAAGLNRLMTLVYDELRGIAHNHRIGERDEHTLTTTALVHEAFLELVDLTRIDWRDRAHFFAVAAGVMRRVLVDYARRYNAAKRGGRLPHVALDEAAIAIDQRADTLIAVDMALERLSEVDERLARVVECRYFAGLSDEESAAALGVSLRTVRRDWTKAKGWLHQELAT